MQSKIAEKVYVFARITLCVLKQLTLYATHKQHAIYNYSLYGNKKPKQGPFNQRYSIDTI
jgi:hypothetical protein